MEGEIVGEKARHTPNDDDFQQERRIEFDKNDYDSSEESEELVDRRDRYEFYDYIDERYDNVDESSSIFDKVINLFKFACANCFRITVFSLIMIPIYCQVFCFLLSFVFTYNPSQMVVEKVLVFNYDKDPPTTRKYHFDPSSSKSFIQDIVFEIEVPKNSKVSNLGRFMVNVEFFEEKNESKPIYTLYHPIYISYSQGFLVGLFKHYILPLVFFIIKLVVQPFDFMGWASSVFSFFFPSKKQNQMRFSLFYKINMLSGDSYQIKKVNEALVLANQFRVVVNNNDVSITGSRIKFISSISGWRYYIVYHPYLSFGFLLSISWLLITILGTSIFCGFTFWSCFGKKKKKKRKLI